MNRLVQLLEENVGPNCRFKSNRDLSRKATNNKNPNLVSDILSSGGRARPDSLRALGNVFGLGMVDMLILAGILTEEDLQWMPPVPDAEAVELVQLYKQAPEHVKKATIAGLRAVADASQE